MVRDSDSKVLSLATGTRTVLTRGGLYADAIVVIWQNKDFSLFDSDYVSALVSKLPLDMVSSATTRSLHVVTTMGAKDEDEESLASTPITSQGSKSFHKDDAYLPVEGGKPGLSKGAKAGIAFGILFLVIGVAVVIVVVMRYRKRQKYVPKPAEGARQQNLPELVEARNNVRRGEDVKRAASA